jgi:hypothetical protein
MEGYIPNISSPRNAYCLIIGWSISGIVLDDQVLVPVGGLVSGAVVDKILGIFPFKERGYNALSIVLGELFDPEDPIGQECHINVNSSASV